MITDDTPAEWAKDAVRYMEQWFPGYLDNMPRSIPGLSVAVYQDGKPIFAEGYGHADRESGTMMTPEHMFHIASHSKAVTAIAVMQLVEQGKLSLTDPASRYIPELLENPDEHLHHITVQDLLAHKASLSRDMQKNYWSLQEPFPDKAELLETARTQPHVDVSGIDKDPKTHYKYSNYGYGLLGVLIENLSGQSYEDYLIDNIFKPLGLTDKDITVEYKPENKNRQATAYSRIGLGGKQVGFRESAISTNALASATGLCATPSAIAKLFSALLPDNDQLLSRESKAKMISADGVFPHHYAKYGLGLQKNKETGLYGHTGASPLERSSTFVNPENGIVVSLVYNGGNALATPLNEMLHDISRFFHSHKAPETNMQPYDGLTFCTVSGTVLTTARKNKEGKDIIYISTAGDAKPFDNASTLHPNGDNHDFTIHTTNDMLSRGEKASFTQDGDGRFTALTIGGKNFLPPDILEKMMKRMSKVAPTRTSPIPYR